MQSIGIKGILIYILISIVSFSFGFPQTDKDNVGGAFRTKRSIIHSKSKEASGNGLNHDLPLAPFAPTPTIQESAPTIQESAPTIQESAPTIQEPAPTIEESVSPNPEESESSQNTLKTKSLEKPDNYDEILANAKKQVFQEIDEEFEEEKISKFQGRGGTNNQALRWKDYKLMYQFENDFPPKIKNIIEASLTTLSFAMSSCFKFKEILNQAPLGIDYILFKWKNKGADCHTYLGKLGKGKAQDLVLSAGCSNIFGVAMHEMMHALGFYHEHVRPDRDQFIKVNDNMIPVNRKKQYEIVQDQTLFAPEYDFDSVLHYPLGRVIEARPGKLQSGVRVGQRDHLSNSDKLRLKGMYPCDKAPSG